MRGQHRDTQSRYGQCSVLLSQHGHLLEGFCLSQHTPFKTLVRSLFICSVDKPSGTAMVDVPELIAGITFYLHTPEPYFRVVAALGAVPDLLHTPQGCRPPQDRQPWPLTAAYGPWHPVRSGAPASTLELRLPVVPPVRTTPWCNSCYLLIAERKLRVISQEPVSKLISHCVISILVTCLT